MCFLTPTRSIQVHTPVVPEVTPVDVLPCIYAYMCLYLYIYIYIVSFSRPPKGVLVLGTDGDVTVLNHSVPLHSLDVNNMYEAIIKLKNVTHA